VRSRAEGQARKSHRRISARACPCRVLPGHERGARRPPGRRCRDAWRSTRQGDAPQHQRPRQQQVRATARGADAGKAKGASASAHPEPSLRYSAPWPHAASATLAQVPDRCVLCSASPPFTNRRPTAARGGTTWAAPAALARLSRNGRDETAADMRGGVRRSARGPLQRLRGCGSARWRGSGAARGAPRPSAGKGAASVVSAPHLSRCRLAAAALLSSLPRAARFASSLPNKTCAGVLRGAEFSRVRRLAALTALPPPKRHPSTSRTTSL
jgi:hypothetical protein